MTRCAFEGCDNLYVPCSRMTFFNLPKDQARRDIWIANSGNRRLMVEYIKNKNIRRLFCEKHFRDQYKKCQFNRTTLSAEAIPDVYNKQLAEDFIRKGRIKIEPVDIEDDTPEEVPIAVVAPRNHKEHDDIVNLIEIDEFDEPERGASASECDILEAEEATSDIDTEAMQTVNKLIKSYREKKPVQTASQKLLVREDSDSPELALEVEADAEDSMQFGQEEQSEYVVQIPDWENSQDMIFQYAQTSQEVVEETPAITENVPISGQDEEDRCFVLSLLEPLKKLTSEQRAVAKVNILKYLLELEVGKKNATL